MWAMVYLLHFERGIGDAGKRHGQAQHYVGYCADGTLRERLAVHRAGRGAAITAYLVGVGIGFEVARVWAPGDKKLERRIKDRKEGPRLCPICDPGGWAARAGYGVHSWRPGVQQVCPF